MSPSPGLGSETWGTASMGFALASHALLHTIGKRGPARQSTVYSNRALPWPVEHTIGEEKTRETLCRNAPQVARFRLHFVSRRQPFPGQL